MASFSAAAKVEAPQWIKYQTSGSQIDIAEKALFIPNNIIKSEDAQRVLERIRLFFSNLKYNDSAINSDFGTYESGWQEECPFFDSSGNCRSSHNVEVRRDFKRDDVVWITLECQYQSYFIASGWRTYEQVDVAKKNCFDLKDRLMLALQE